MNVNELLKNRRIELGYTMKELADLIGVSEGTVSRWESGEIQNMRRNKVVALSKIFHLTPDKIMGWEMEFVQNNNQGTISNNIGSDTGHNSDSNNNYTTNNYYSSPCEKHAVNHEIEATINSKECFFKVLDCLRDMTDEQLLEVLKYSEYVLNKKR